MPPKHAQDHALKSIFYFRGEKAFRRVIAVLLSTDQEITLASREFIADWLTGKVKKKRVAKNIVRDYMIWDLIRELIDNGEARDNAASQIADEFSIQEDNAIRIYDRIERLINEKVFPFDQIS